MTDDDFDTATYWHVVEIGATGKNATTSAVLAATYPWYRFSSPPADERRKVTQSLIRLHHTGRISFDVCGLCWWPT